VNRVSGGILNSCKLLSFLMLAMTVSPCAFADATVTEAQSSYQSLDTSHRQSARRQAKALRREIEDGNMYATAQRTDEALDALVARGLQKLHEKGDEYFADRFELQWSDKFRGFLTHAMVQNDMRDIGDHKPLIQWLATFYDHLESVLGVNICKSLHLSDIKTFNYCIPIVFHPCTFPMDNVTVSREAEYANHFAQGAVYYGLIPVVVYWVCDISCLAATSGIGAMLCGPLSGGAEFIMGKWFAPKLSNRLFEKVCGT
jgi:hypothetical protein